LHIRPLVNEGPLLEIELLHVVEEVAEALHREDEGFLNLIGHFIIIILKRKELERRHFRQKKE